MNKISTNQNEPLIYLDPKAGASHAISLKHGGRRRFSFHPLSMGRYRQEADVNLAKNLSFPHLRGTWIPSFDIQKAGFGIAVNWLGIRARLSLMS